LPTTRHRIFRAAWWSSNLLLATAAVSLVYAGVWEVSVRRYLKGFSDAIVPISVPPEQKTEAILDWMRGGAPRSVAADPSVLSTRNPESTLNYQQLLSVCGTATNAFLNLARSAGLEVRRLLLLGPNGRTKHVVAEVLIDQRWVIVDPAYRLIMRDAQGRFLTRKDLQDPLKFAQATSVTLNYPSEYSYEQFAHIRFARIPMQGLGLRRALNSIYPGWDELLDWSLLLERESFFVLITSAAATIFFSLARVLLAWYADHRLRIPRFHFLQHVARAGAAFFSTPEIK
jgi:transglutaminase superfamily protein